MRPEPEAAVEQLTGAAAPPANFRLGEVAGDLRGAKTRARANLEAIAVLKGLGPAGHADRGQQAVLARYVGWGGIPQIFDERNAAWAAERAELQALVADAEYREMRGSTLNAHYTTLPVVRALYGALEAAGYDGRGEVLEPAAGIGHFIGAGPADQRVTAVELDPVTAGIAQKLYPASDIHTTGFQSVAAGDGSRDFDLVVGNPPFGNYRVHDPRHRDLGALTIHNYFLVKSVRALRPGGLAAFVVSRFFMDAANGAARELVHEHCDLVGAARLPETAFLRNAGTSVVADVLVFRRRREGEPPLAEVPAWLESRLVHPDPELPEESVHVNGFILDNPHLVLGEVSMSGSQHFGNTYTVRAADVDPDDQTGMGRRLTAALGPQMRPGLYAPEEGVQAIAVDAGLPDLDELAPSPHLRRVGGLMVHGEPGAERIYRLERDAGGLRVSLAEVMDEDRSDRDRARTAGLLAIRDSLRGLLEAEWAGEAEPVQLAAQREELNRRLDAFRDAYCTGTSQYNSAYNRRMLRDEPDAALVLSLYDDEADETATILHRRVHRERPPAADPATPEEAAVMSFAETGAFSPAYCAERLGRPEREVEAHLLGRGLAFRDPDTGTAVWHEDYLSGNVRHKLARARRAAEHDSAYAGNVEALERVLPPEVGPEAIHVQLESPWMPERHYCDFFRELTGLRIAARRDGLRQQMIFTELPFSQQDPGLSLDERQLRMGQIHGTDRRGALDLLTALANARQIVVHDTDIDGYTRVNGEETARARLKAEDMQQRFADWVWADADRTQELAEAYNERFNSHVLRNYDGGFLRFPGLATGQITLRRNQRDAAFRMIVARSSLIDHVVGAGKTASGVAATQEQRRMGVARKPLVAVPNHLVGAWEMEAQRLYPGIKVLALRQGQFTSRTRREFLARAAVQDWDLIIASHSALKIIPNRPESETAIVEEQLAQLDALLGTAQRDLEAAGNEYGPDTANARKSVKQMEKARKALTAKLDRLLDKPVVEDTLHWEDLGVDSFVLDEAHEFKNLGFETGLGQVAGLGNPQGSQRALDLLVKIRAMRRLHPESRCAFLTGTPIANSVAEAYHMLRYLHPEGLAERGVDSVDTFVRSFAEISTDYEIDITGTRFQAKTRLRNFANLGALQTLYREVVDSVTNDDLEAMYQAEHNEPWPIPRLEGGQPRIHDLERSELLGDLVDDVIARMEVIRSGQIDPREDNNLKCLTDARVNSLDVRIRGHAPAHVRDPDSKVERAAVEIVRIHEKWKAERGTQLVFCDLSTPRQHLAALMEEIETLARQVELEGSGEAADRLALLRLGVDGDGDFDVYNELKARLIEVSGGSLTANEIAFIHDYNTPKRKDDLFAAVNRGEVRVLMGSTAKMGTGMNVQQRLVALHHLDVPWRPCDLEQREGRILRQGNLLYRNNPVNFFVEIHRYGTRNTTDAFFWQTLESKGRFLDCLRRGDLQQGEVMEDMSNQTLSYAEMKAVTTGDPRVLDELRLGQAINALRARARQHEATRHRHRRTVADLEHHEERHLAQADRYARALAVLAEHPEPQFVGGDFGAEPLVRPAGKEEDELVRDFDRRVRDWRGQVANRLTGIFSELRGGLLAGEHRFRYRGIDVVMDSKDIVWWGGRRIRTVRMEALFEGEALAHRLYGPDDTFSPSGLETTLQHGLEGLEAKRSAERAAIDRDNQILERAREGLAEPFPRAAELAGLEAEHNALRKALGLTPRGARAAPPDADKSAGTVHPEPETCTHCNDRLVRGLHLPPESKAPVLAVGQRVAARRATGVCRVGEQGVAVEAYEINGRPGWTILFEHGGADGWSPCEVGLLLEVGDICADAAVYAYVDSVRLSRDWKRGRFAKTFALPPVKVESSEASHREGRDHPDRPPRADTDGAEPASTRHLAERVPTPRVWKAF